MKKLIPILVLCMLVVFCWSNPSSAAMKPPNLIGTWTGTAQGANETEFLTMQMTLEITQQEGAAFIGTIAFDTDAAFAVSGVVVANGILKITGSESVFEALIVSGKRVKKIGGTGQKIATADSPSATIAFILSKTK